MLSNKVKRNIWLTLAVVSVGCMIDRAIRVIDGSAEWWDLAATIVILCHLRKRKKYLLLLHDKECARGTKAGLRLSQKWRSMNH